MLNSYVNKQSGAQYYMNIYQSFLQFFSKQTVHNDELSELVSEQ